MRTHPLVIVIALALVAVGRVAAADSSPPAPDPVMARINQAASLVRQGSFDEALARFIEPVIAEFGKEYAGRHERIYCSSSSVETLLYLTQSAAKNESAVAVSPAYAYAYFLKGYILIDRKDLAAALPFLLKAVELSPSNPQYLSELGHIHQTNREWSKALETFDRAIEGARTLHDQASHSEILRRALRGRGYSLIEMGRLDEAEKVYAECLGLDPDDRTAQGELKYIKGLRLKPAATK
jgi:tetratricopeptide (TPR) repeat protein